MKWSILCGINGDSFSTLGVCFQLDASLLLWYKKSNSFFQASKNDYFLPFSFSINGTFASLSSFVSLLPCVLAFAAILSAECFRYDVLIFVKTLV